MKGISIILQRLENHLLFFLIPFEETKTLELPDEPDTSSCWCARWHPRRWSELHGDAEFVLWSGRISEHEQRPMPEAEVNYHYISGHRAVPF